MTQSSHIHRPGTESLVVLWSVIDWGRVRRQVEQAQCAIAEAAAKRDLAKIEELQEALVHSLLARMLAVHTVSQNRGSRTAGIDGERWTTQEELFAGVFAIETDEYRSCPLRRIYIPKGTGDELRPISIPTLDDRVVQTLYALALQPVAETWADRCSFGFQRGRSAKDACACVRYCLGRRSSPGWVLEGDIRNCFDTISHEWLCRNIPMNQKVLTEVLKAGYLEHGEVSPTEAGVPQGGPLSPFLANMALDGMENLLNAAFKRKKVHLARYADDFIVTADTEATAHKVMNTIASFLAERGMALSDEKTKITRVSDGFDFLGWHFNKSRGDLVVAPTARSVERVQERIRTTIHAHRDSDPDPLIGNLNLIVRSWCSYHNHIRPRETFEALDRFLADELAGWKEHGRSAGRQASLKPPRMGDAGEGQSPGSTNRLTRFSETPYRPHPYSSGGINPYLNPVSLSEKSSRQEPDFLVL
jgi:RNA-directed DNA polymerase